MTAFQKLWRFIWTGITATGVAEPHRGAVRNDLAALRLYSLPRGVRQRTRHFLLEV